MGSDEVQGLTVRVRDGYTLGVVVGVFAEGPLAGRLRVQGTYARGRYRAEPQDGIAVYAIPRSAVVRRRQDSLLLGVPLSRARARWLMHVALIASRQVVEKPPWLPAFVRPSWPPVGPVSLPPAG
jgi:hypothetical protein